MSTRAFATRARRPGMAVLAELRFRLAVRRLRAPGGTADALAQVLLYVVALPVAIALAAIVGVGTYRAVRLGQGPYATVTLTAILYGVWQIWTAVSLSVNERDALDLRRLLVYPVRPLRVYLLGLLSSLVADPFAVLWLSLLAAMAAGAAVARPGWWILPLVALLTVFSLATAALVALGQEILARVARRRRWREAAALAAILAWLALVYSLAGGVQTLRAARPAFRIVRWLLYPAAFASEGAKQLLGGHPLAALPWMALLFAAAALATFAAYRLALATAVSGGDAVTEAALQPRSLWPEPFGPLLEKELLYLSRHPATRIYLVILPAIAALLGWKLPVQRAGEFAGLVSILPLFGIAAYVHLAVQMFWVNALGWERGGARVFFLAPVAPGRVLAAKNVALAAYATLLFTAAAGAYALTAGPPPAWALVAAFVLELGLAPALYALGNLVTITMPRAAPFGVQRAGSVSAVAAIAGMGITSGTLMVWAIPVLVALRGDALWLIPAGWTVLGLAAAVAWRATLPLVGRLLLERQESVLAAVCGDEA